MPTKQHYIDNYGEEWYINYRKHLEISKWKESGMSNQGIYREECPYLNNFGELLKKAADEHKAVLDYLKDK